MKTHRHERRRIPWPVVKERNHILLLVAFSFLIGCLSAVSLRPGIWLWATLAIGVGLAILLRLLGARAGLAIALCFFSLGVLRTHAALHTAQPEPGSYEIAGYVAGGTRLRSDNRVTFTLTEVTLSGEPASGLAYCSVHYDEEPPELFDGARVRFQGRVYLPDGQAGETHMDFRLWMRQNGLSFGIAAYQELEVENVPETAPVKDATYRIRETFRLALERVMGDDSRVAMALLFGEREGLSEEEYRSFQNLGIAHVMSVSGLHVGILGSLLEWLLRRLRLRRTLRLPIVAVFLTAYCAITGFSAAAMRASVMLLLYMSARLLGRFADPMTILAEAMLAVLLLKPLQAMSAGFILSFSAMLGILLLSPRIREIQDRLWPELRVYAHGTRKGRLLQVAKRFQSDLKSLLRVSLSAQLGVLLPTAVYFHQLPLYGLFINLLIVPLVSSLLTPLYLTVLTLSSFPLIGPLLGATASLLTKLLLALLALLSSLPNAVIRVAAPPTILCLGLGAACVTLNRRVPGRLGRKAIAALLMLMIALGGAYLEQPADVRYIQLSVGQADSALLMDGPTTVLIDAGDDGQAALDYLLSEGRNVDALFLTHLHMDHVGGVTALLDAGIRISRVYLPVNAEKQLVDSNALAILDRLRAENVPIIELARGDELRYNETGLQVLWPERNGARAGHDANDMPLVLAIRFGGYTILSASDLTGTYEAYSAIPADVLKVAHHGSAESTYDAYLSSVAPRFALISCSSASSSLPSRETLSRLAASGAVVLRTDTCGDITLSLRDGQLYVTPYKESETP